MLPRRTVRMRLTLVYGGLVLASGIVLLVITYLLVRSSGLVIINKGDVGTLTTVMEGSDAGQAEMVRTLLLESGLALLIMLVVSIALGWIVAGRMLRPLRTITAAAQQISASNLHQRIGLAGPDDELKDLADTFDGLLGRLEGAFDAQRQFVANASHELRTPLARQRTLLEVALADPEASAGSLSATCRRVLVAGEQQERLIEALLTLARSQRGLARRTPVDLAAVADDVVETRRTEAEKRGLTLTADLAPARALGDERLAERLVANLVDNAIRHNVAGGKVWVRLAGAPGEAVLSVANTGPTIPPGEVGRLFLPFRRLDATRTAHRDGHGLGLSIVNAIAEAHGAAVRGRPLADGGLEVEVRFPAGWAAWQPAGTKEV